MIVGCVRSGENECCSRPTFSSSPGAPNSPIPPTNTIYENTGRDSSVEFTMTAVTEHRSIFDYCLQDPQLDLLREVTGVQSQEHSDPPSHTHGGVALCPVESLPDENQRDAGPAREVSVSDRMVCSACQCPFDTREDQMEHYKLDWHRFNLRKRIVGETPVTMDEFERKTGIGDMSSISGTDSDSEDSDSDGDRAVNSNIVVPAESQSSLEAESAARLSNRVVFQNSQGQYLSVYRCVLQNKSGTEGDMVASLRDISHKSIWVVLMTGGGHFAGAVFQGREVLQHKTFHRYTVRAKRGTAQGLRDSQNRSHAPKSAGAALRRYNEAALVKEIQDLLESWSEHLKEAGGIFLRAPSYNKTIFYGGRTAALDKKDPRVRTLPFATRRATFREVKRVHDMLSSLHVYGKDVEVSDIFSPSKKVWKKKEPKASAQPSAEGETAGESVTTSCSSPTGARSDGGSGEEGSITLEAVEVTLGTLDLREYEVQPTRKRRRRRKEGRHGWSQKEADEQEEALEPQPPQEEDSEERPGKSKGKRKPQSKKTQPEEEVAEAWEYGMRDALYTACKVGDLDSLRSLLQLPEETGDQGGDRSQENLEDQENPEVQEVQENPEVQNQESCPSQDLTGLGPLAPALGPLAPALGPLAPALGPLAPALGPLALLNRPIDSSGFTLLHVASAAGQKGVVRFLMDMGCDPACRDKKGQTPYAVAPEKDTRTTFRKYMAENPDKYNYSKAQVPALLTAELEAKKTEKKKAQKAAKKQREKEQKEERKKLELEAEEKKRFASLTDREKRALAAEKRLAAQKATTGDSLSNTRRCWQCGESLLGKVPFQYLDFTFCTPGCVQAHRKANAPPART